MKHIFSQLHARIFLEDLKLQTSFKSKEACIIYQALIRNSKYVNIEDDILIRKSNPSQEYFQRTIGLTKYKVKKGIAELKKINVFGESLTPENVDSFIPILHVKRRMGTSAVYTLKTNFKKVEHVRPNEKSNMNDQTKSRTWSTVEKSNMNDHGKVEHERPKTKLKQTIEHNYEQYYDKKFSFLFDDD
ncbi:MAG: hypothetical protein CMD97_05780 [Gammaproteobacteria bacterium]|nr:hypothetical protein [Gammaproteobacteria bacterium]|tara:strand:- start:173 stop:736 length:564 start_codon:yes stop_codon:yes gene_type:complete